MAKSNMYMQSTEGHIQTINIEDGGTGNSNVLLPKEGGTLASKDYVDNSIPYAMQRMTAVATTSGTYVDFTGIPSWAKKITIMFAGVSTSGTSPIIIQIGTNSGIMTSGYTSGAMCSSNSAGTVTTGLVIQYTAAYTAAYSYSGIITIANISNDTWLSAGNMNTSTLNYSSSSAGTVTAADILTTIRITTINGTDTFDAGIVNVIYEG